MLSTDDAAAEAGRLHGYHVAERTRLDRIRRYWQGRQPLPTVISPSSPLAVRTMARIARVNVCKIVVDSLAQSLFVDGFRTKDDPDESAVWATWQANRMDARQTGIHRAAAAYGCAYTVVVPGDPVPVIRGVSPRNMTAMYGDDPDWPVYALERRRHGNWRLYDDQAIYELTESRIMTAAGKASLFSVVSTTPHGSPVTPVIRYIDEDDLDAEDDVPENEDLFGRELLDEPLRGQVAQLMPLQDQIDLTTFEMLVAQHFAAFRQRYAIGWVADDETQLLKASAAQLWTFDQSPSEMTLGEFSATPLDGYIASRAASMRHVASLSQTPAHELISDLVNLSAEALAAAEQGHERKVDERKTLFGESHEQTLWVVGQLTGVDVPDDAQVVWRDTSVRAFSATVDALGKLAQMLGIPPQELWERVPGTTQQDIERWKAAAANSNAFDELARMLSAETSAGANVNVNE